MPMRELYIDGDAMLRAYLEALEPVELIALDTEFVRETTYSPQLCLVQIAAGDTIACIDCLAGIGLGRLFDALLDERRIWIVHSARQDLEVVHQHAGRLPHRLIDTQIAAALLGYPPQVSLQELVADVVGVVLDKTHTRTDWSRRPLPAAALEYARDDVRSLHALWAALADRLDSLGRREWLEQDCSLLLAQAPVTPTEQIFSRLRGLRSLDTEAQCAALALVEWREDRAREKNRPRRWILSDEQLVGIARARPPSTDALRESTDLPKRLVERAGQELLAALRAARAPAYRQRVARSRTAEKPDEARLRELQTRAKARAAELGIYPEILATKQELTDLSMQRVPERIEQTWRAATLEDLIGEPERAQ